MISHQSFLLITCSTAWRRPHSEGRLIKVFIYKPCPKSPPLKKKTCHFSCQAIFFITKFQPLLGCGDFHVLFVNKANTLTTAGLSVLDVAQSFRLETFSDVAFQSLGDWMMGWCCFCVWTYSYLDGSDIKEWREKNDWNHGEVWYLLYIYMSMWFGLCMNVWFDEYILSKREICFDNVIWYPWINWQ